MTAATVLPPEVAAYLGALRAALTDLPAEERDDLLAEVEASLLDTASESDWPIADRLGPPEAFAAELRVAAGLQPASPLPGRPESPSPLASARAAMSAFLADPRVRSARQALSELAPIWWLGRAYVAVAALALLTRSDWSSSYRVLPRFGDSRLALLALAVATGLSLGLGLRSRRLRGSGRQAIIAANVALAVATVPVISHLLRLSPPRPATQILLNSSPPTPGLALNGVPLRNVYPYSRSGRLLHDVLLYSDAGRPLDIGRSEKDATRRLLHTATGGLTFNAFPIRYFEPGTRVVAHPNAGPRVRLPRVVTPPLKPKENRPR